MKAIIGRKRYDTETAKCIASWSNGCSRSDFHHIEEALYITGKGSWFLHGGGGPLTSYGVPCGNNGTSGSERIKPLTAEEAYAWLEAHDQVDALEEHLATEVEDA